jgi:hypothetical protein
VPLPIPSAREAETGRSGLEAELEAARVTKIQQAAETAARLPAAEGEAARRAEEPGQMREEGSNQPGKDVDEAENTPPPVRPFFLGPARPEKNVVFGNKFW